jgi:hypothetical protein
MTDGDRHSAIAEHRAARPFARTFAASALVCVSLGASSAAGTTHRAVQAAATPTSVRFSFSGHGSSSGGYLYSFAGSGTMKLADVVADTVAHAQYGTSTITIRRGGLSATFTVFSTGYSYAFTFLKDETLQQTVKLKGHFTRSTIGACHVGSSGLVAVLTAASSHLIAARVCGSTFSFKGGAASIVPVPRPALLPSELTLTVAGTSCVAHTGKNCYRPGDGGDPASLAANSSLSIEASIDHPLANGWVLDVYRPGDPAAPSAYYLVCSTSTETSCEDTRPGKPKGSVDGVFAVVHPAVGGPVLLAQIEVDWT